MLVVVKLKKNSLWKNTYLILGFFFLQQVGCHVLFLPVGGGNRCSVTASF